MNRRRNVFYWVLNLLGGASAIFLVWQAIAASRATEADSVQIPDASPPPQLAIANGDSPELVESDLRSALARKDRVLLDTRDRADFEQAHIDGALNIPLDEIESRAPHELPKGETIYVYCHTSKACGRGRKIDCKTTSVVLGWAAVQNVKYVDDDLSRLAAMGISIAGTPCK